MTESRIGPGTTIRELGRGGMDVVYLARDGRLARDVAIMSLPEHLARDRERLAGFERKAPVVAQLNRSNSASIGALEEHEGKKYLAVDERQVLFTAKSTRPNVEADIDLFEERRFLMVQDLSGPEASNTRPIVVTKNWAAEYDDR